jgi:hypothetical protein
LPDFASDGSQMSSYMHAIESAVEKIRQSPVHDRHVENLMKKTLHKLCTTTSTKKTNYFTKNELTTTASKRRTTSAALINYNTIAHATATNSTSGNTDERKKGAISEGI